MQRKALKAMRAGTQRQLEELEEQLAEKKRRQVKLWAASDLKTLKSRAGKDSVESIAKNLKRTPSAMRQKATSLGISLRARSR